MKNDRLRIQVDDDYLVALGRAVFVFAGLESNVVWCCERIEPGYIQTFSSPASSKKNAAGAIAKKFKNLVRNLPASATKTVCRPLADEFGRLAERRNDLLHAVPGTSSASLQHTFRFGSEWTISSIDDIADEFAACSILLNAVLYDELKA